MTTSLDREAVESRRAWRFYGAVAGLPVVALLILGIGSRQKPQVYTTVGATPWAHRDAIRWHGPLARLDAIDLHDTAGLRAELTRIDDALARGVLPVVPPATADDVASEQGVKGDIVRGVNKAVNGLLSESDVTDPDVWAKDALLARSVLARVSRFDATAPSLTGMVERRALTRLEEVASSVSPEVRRAVIASLSRPRPSDEKAIRETRTAFLHAAERCEDAAQRLQVRRAMDEILALDALPLEAALAKAKMLRARPEFHDSDAVPAMPAAMFGALAERHTRLATSRTLAAYKKA